ncbi:MAG: septum formation inhibitor Maf [Gammaproteobacteria bacterium]|nr:septum formation inhibitor Maf [Gammaproteobacteria bacterium]
MSNPLIYLASQSPRRRELLSQIGVVHEIIAAEVDENPLPSEAPEVYVIRMALAKARAGASRLTTRKLPVLGADTSVVLDGQILGKPRDQVDGIAMLQRLAGRSHQVLTAVALVDPEDLEHAATRLSISSVSFRQIDDAECQAYWQTGEPADKAGGYGIQGYAAIFIQHLEGSFSGVMGLPLFETAELMQEFEIDISGSW